MSVLLYVFGGVDLLLGLLFVAAAASEQFPEGYEDESGFHFSKPHYQRQHENKN